MSQVDSMVNGTLLSVQTIADQFVEDGYAYRVL